MSVEAIRMNGYSFSKPLTSDNSGFSKWGIGTRGGKSFFVKEFLSPVYPRDDAVFSEKKKQDRIRLCEAFVDKRRKLYSALREAYDGHIVTVEQFFRVGSRYYISTKAITEPILSVEDISKAYFLDKLYLCCSIAHAMGAIHRRRIVHADIKPNNILVVREKGLRANIIDFDCSFFEEDCPKPGEELNGDLVYLSPEGFLHIAGEESKLSCQMDVFALGLLFYQYFTGELPGFNREEYRYAYESVLDGQALDLSGIPNEACRSLFEDMVKREPEDRPDIGTVFLKLRDLLLKMLNRKELFNITVTAVDEDGFFQMAGDL